MKTLYLDLISGISGDMFLGALVDLGVELPRLEQGLARLGVGGYRLQVERGQKQGITGTRFEVRLEPPLPPTTGHRHDPGPSSPHQPGHHPPHSHPNDGDVADGAGHSRDFAQIRQLIQASTLPDWVRERATAIFRRIAVAEGKIHGCPPDKVHFHEVGAVDSIVDIVGGCLALDLLGRPRVGASPVVEGTGWVRCAHGRFPVPTPATVEILAARGIALSQCEERHELVTPTGAALLAELAETFGALQDFRLERVGYGLGHRDHQTRPNVLRALLGETIPAGGGEGAGQDWETDRVAVLECNLDDLNPEVLGHFQERALRAGALDVFYTAVQMKKGRPGVLLTLLCPVQDADRFSALLLTETSAFGVRQTVADRRKLRREVRPVQTPWGEVRIKRGLLNGRVVQAAPEFEDCRRVAESAQVPLKAVYEAAVRAGEPRHDSETDSETAL